MDKTPHWKPRAKVEKVIIVEYLAGAGTPEDPARVNRIVYDLDGRMIADYDAELSVPKIDGEFIPWEETP